MEINWSGAWRAVLTLEKRRLTQEQWRLTFHPQGVTEPCMNPEACMEAHPGAEKAQPEQRRLTLEPKRLTLEPKRLTLELRIVFPF